MAYRVVGSTALVVGDPLIAPADRPAVLDGFLAHCCTCGWTPAFYQTLGATLPHYRARGPRALAIGREALIDLPAFTLSGKRIANVRHSVTHAERAGLRVELYAAGELAVATRAELRALSDEWLRSCRRSWPAARPWSRAHDLAHVRAVRVHAGRRLLFRQPTGDLGNG